MGKRLYSCNESYFLEIDSSRKAYWLGFLWADGCLSKKGQNSYRLLVELNPRDIELLEYLSCDLNSTYPIYKSQRRVRLSIQSEKLFTSLIKLGFCERKTYSESVVSVPIPYIKDFVRGLFDGDRCITTKGTKEFDVHIVGNKPTCELLLNSTRSILSLGGGIYPLGNQMTYRWRLGGKRQISKFGIWIYQGADLYLSRKQERFEGWGLLNEDSGKLQTGV